ncbi:MAG: sulfite exporter TauE/SafE family protein, partial [Verrucomicrobiota bacterium]
AGGFVVSPLMVLAIGASDGLAVLATIMLVASALSCWQHRKEVQRQLLQPLIAAALFGTALGGLILWALVSSGAEAAIHYRLEIVVGALTLFYTVLIALRDKIEQGGPGRPPRWLETFGAGSIVGITQVVANSGSPLLTLFFLRFGIHKDRFVAAQAFYLAVQNLAKLAPLILLGILHLGNASTAVLLLPLLVLGGWVGARVYQNCSEGFLFRLYTACLVLGCVASFLLIWGRDKLFGLL